MAGTDDSLSPTLISVWRVRTCGWLPGVCGGRGRGRGVAERFAVLGKWFRSFCEITTHFGEEPRRMLVGHNWHIAREKDVLGNRHGICGECRQ